MELLYTVNLNSDEPIMLIDKHIGFDEEDGVGIMGSQFQKELLFLDTLKKKRIQVWINSPGGMVRDGYDICNAILRTKTKVDTYCYGLAASIAAPIFLSGRTRYMADYGMLMVHEAYEESVNEAGEKIKSQSESTLKMNDSIVNIIVSRAGIDESKLRGMMKEETWLSASEAKEEGMCDVIESSSNLNIPRIKKEDSVKAMYRAFEPVFNKAKNFNKKPLTMKKVANKLNLNDEANEESIVNAIVGLETKNKATQDALDKANEEMEKAKAKFGEEEKKYKQMEEEFNKMKAEFEVEKNKAKAAVEAEAKNKAETLVKENVKLGKIKNEASESWVKQAMADFEGTKNMLDSIALNKTAPKIVSTLNKAAEAIDGVPTIDNANPNAWAAVMNGKKLAEAKNRIK